MLAVSDLHKSYGTNAVLRGVDLAVRPGQILGLIGNNGQGKTTLISCATGLVRKDSGSILIDGIDADAHRTTAARSTGVAPQRLGIFPTLTARANLVALGTLNGMSRRDAARRTIDLAERLDIADALDKRADVLSGGQQRRLHTAMALLHRPRLLFLDEPTVGADVASREAILQVVADLASQGTAIVYTTHYLTELETLNADIAVLDAGRIAARGPVRDLVRHWARSTIRLRFTGEAPTLPGWQAADDTLTRTAAADDALDEAGALASALSSLGTHGTRLTGVDMQRPSLESAYLAITGQRFEVDDVDAA